ncbi:septum site-determining protein MinC [Lacticaseibacillus nasuensis]|uniref:Septum formation inhibitor n=1 Tax=Lacticaseibacillus nasuensis JCM 17158 TaxID=1291734 RepID=A0A0R1JQ46_9LACO|nr:septum site-determining protein MinC [Lacticaseibacillus nasuensis]KRK73227.1 septum formation inhibitor [Lacticaseibacillus nasuensis JCM 17158]
MDAVTLKGRKAGFEIQLADAASLAEIQTQLQELLTKLAQDTPDEGNVEFVLETGQRLLTAEQAESVKAVFADFDRFTVSAVHAAVDTPAAMREAFLSRLVHLNGDIIRSGQTVTVDGDVLFTGNLHQGGTLAASGSVFMLGQAQGGLIIAGSHGDQAAIIAGDIHHAGQIRIADTIEIIEKKNQYSADTLSLINDLHILDHGSVTQLAKLRPRLFRKLEDM